MKGLSLAFLVTFAGLALAGCGGSASQMSLLPAAPFKVAQTMLAGGRRFALGPGAKVAGVVGGTPNKPVPSVVVSRLPPSTPVVVAKEWAEAAARGRNDPPWFGVTATLVRATATTTPVGGGRTRTLMSDRTAWLVLIPEPQALVPGKPGPFNWTFTRAVLIDATSGDYLGGALLPSSSMR
jgi:hypothetical protein